MKVSPDLALVTLVTDGGQFAQCEGSLRGSSVSIPTWVTIDANGRGWNAATALNWAMERLTQSWVACVHQDVIFPPRWLETVARELQSLASDVTVVGLVGTRSDGHFRGHIRDPNGHCFWGPLPADVLTLDEHVLLLRRSEGPRFDPGIPGFHCYGADLCLQAVDRNQRVVVIDAPVTHLSTGTIDGAYGAAASTLLEKWGEKYDWVVPTPPRLLYDRRRAPLVTRWVHRWRRRRDGWRRNLQETGPWTSRS